MLVCSKRVALESGSTGIVYAVEEVVAGGGKVGGSLKLREIEERLHLRLHAVHEFPDETCF